MLVQLGHEGISRLFTDDPLVQREVQRTLGVTSTCIILDSTVIVLIGIIKGIGKQVQATVAYVLCFYLVGLPASYCLCFQLRLGLPGLWWGLLSGLSVLTLALSLIIKHADWALIALEARQNGDLAMLPLFDKSRSVTSSNDDSEDHHGYDLLVDDDEAPYTSFSRRMRRKQ